MQTHKELEDIYIRYMKYKRFTPVTMRNKVGTIRLFLSWLEKQHLELLKCTYGDMISFLKLLQQNHYSVANQNEHLTAIRQLYDALILEEKTLYNPVSNLRVRGRIDRLPHNLMTLEELDNLYHSYKPQTDFQFRNKIILGLYVYQALIRIEINALTLQDINLDKGIIHIRKNTKLAERILPLAAHQVLSLQEYITRIRPQLLKQSDYEKGDRLFFTYAHGQTVNESLKKFLQILRKNCPKLKKLQQIRSSVIGSWVKDKPIREVQYLAGHSDIKSTQRYREVNMQDLHASLGEFHPLK